MKKKRNTTSKANETVSNLLFTVLCLSCAFYCVFLFFKSFNQALTKINEEPIATITFKYKTAQRKFIDRVIWDRLQQESPVYNGDTIRTAPLSEATIYFSDGNIMELYENTMAQVFLNEAGLAADLTDGSLAFDSTASSSSVTLTSGENSVKLDSGTKLTAKQSDTLKVLVEEGNAVLTSGATGEEKALASGSLLLVDKTGEMQKTVFAEMISPLPQSKILYHNKKECDVLFNWKKQNMDSYKVLLEISENKDFSSSYFKNEFIEETQINLALNSGIWYYRLTPIALDDSDNSLADSSSEKIEVSQGKITLMYAPAPELLVPVEDYHFSYRTKTPVVRFIWEENQYATSWQLEVADNADFTNPVITQRTSSPSSIVSTLEEGTWYWRVTPYYSINNVGLKAPSDVRKFMITKSGDLQEVALLLPEKNGSVDSATDKTTTFSWKNEREAVSYTLKIAKNKELSSSVIKKEVTENYATINPAVDGLSDGVWYWGVTQTDAEGNNSEISEIRPIIVSQGSLFQRTVFPPNDYKIADGRLTDLYFMWKTNIPFATKFQIAEDSSFNKILIDETVSVSSATGKNLPVGEYYWRIKADTEELDYSTSPKKFTILPPLDKALAVDPREAGLAIIRPNKPYKFKWQTVQNADYYTFKLFKTASNRNTEDLLIYEKSFIEESNCSVDLTDTEDGLYHWTVQGFAQETPIQTRRSGLLADYSFTLKHIHPVRLLRPTRNATIDGSEAIRNPQKAVWQTVDTNITSVFYLSQSANPTESPVLVLENPKTTVELPRLRPGKYFWTVLAKTLDNIDISAENPSTFTVTPIPPLNAVTGTQPKTQTVLDVQHFKANQNIQFTWNKVDLAEDYVFSIKNADGEICFETMTTETSYLLEDLTILDRGDFTWEVLAQNYYEGVLFQTSEPVISRFTIDLPPLKKQKVKLDGVLYGQ